MIVYADNKLIFVTKSEIAKFTCKAKKIFIVTDLGLHNCFLWVSIIRRPDKILSSQKTYTEPE